MEIGYLGIDASKGYSDFVLLNERFEVLEKSVQFDDTRKGHDKVGKWLARCIKKHKLSRVLVGIESTGGFEDNWFALFIELGKTLPLQIARLNPSVVKNAAKAALMGQTTDAISAANIARYVIRYADQVDWQQPESKYRALRSFDNHIRLLVSQRTQLINQLKQLLYYCFPELQRFCKHGIPNWVLELLKAYPTPKKLARARVKTVAKIHYITPKKAQTLIAKAAGTVAARGEVVDGYLIASIAQQLQDKTSQIAQLKSKLTQECEGEEIRLLESIPGIGAYSAVAIMIQIEDIRRFSSPSKLAGYFGVYPSIKQSGDKTPMVRMSKEGRSAIRATLFMCANSAVMKDAHLKKIYHRHRANGKNHKQALGVVMHKLLRIIWGVLTSKTAYAGQIDESNQQKNTSGQQPNQQNEEASKRREQDYDEDAPISRIASKKRKAYQMSQVSNAERVRDLTDTPMHQT